MSTALALPKSASTPEGRVESLKQLEGDFQRLMERARSVKAETADIIEDNERLAQEIRTLTKTVNSVNELDFYSMRHETGVLERAHNVNHRDINILETQLKKLHRSCQVTDMEFNAMLTAINHLATETDQLETVVHHEKSALTPAALQLAFETIQRSLSEKLAVITPEYASFSPPLLSSHHVPCTNHF